MKIYTQNAHIYSKVGNFLECDVKPACERTAPFAVCNMVER